MNEWTNNWMNESNLTLYWLDIFNDSLIGLIDWIKIIEFMIDWLVDWLIDWLNDWFNGTVKFSFW